MSTPEAPPHQQSAAVAAAAPCSRCGSFVARADCLYSDDGEVMCFRCRELLDDVVRKRRAGRLLRMEAYGAGFMGVVGLPVAVFFPLGAFFMSLPAAGAGVRVLRVLMSKPPPRDAMGWHLGPVWVSSVCGLLLGATGLLLMGLHVYALFTGHR